MIWIVLLCALILSFIFSGMESALLAVSRVRVRHAAEKKDARAATLLQWLENRDSLLGAVTIANHVANVGAFAIIVWELVKVVGPWGYAIAFLLALPLFIVGLEVIPKTLFRRYPFRTLRRMLSVIRIIVGLSFIFRVIRAPFTDEEKAAQQDQLADLLHLFKSMVKDGLMPQGTALLMERVLQYRGQSVKNLMKPMEKIVALFGDLPLSIAQQQSRAHNLQFMPVMDHGGTYIGILDLASLAAHLPEDRLVRQHMQPVEWLPDDLSALAALQRLRRRGKSCALVKSASSGETCGWIHEEHLLSPLTPNVEKAALGNVERSS
jgi:CBS domain containing-hemolysin-like protein